MTMFWTGLTVTTLLVSFSGPGAAQTTYSVTYDTVNYDYETDTKFLSIALIALVPERMEGNNPQFKVNNTVFKNLASELGPAGVRLGGTYSNMFRFNPDGRNDSLPQYVIDQWEATFNTDFYTGGIGRGWWQNKEITADQFVKVLQFTQDVNWDLLFDISQLFRNGSEWDPSNFKLLLDYLRDQNLDVPAWQLGNEPNSLGYKLWYVYNQTATATVNDYQKFREVIQSYPEHQNAQIVGPECTSISVSGSARNWFEDFMQLGGANHTDILSLHHYYFGGSDGDNSPEKFLDPAIFDYYKLLCERVNNFTRDYAPGKPVYLTETSDAWSGGSDYSKTFLGTFIFLDQLGLSARYGIQRVYKQTFNTGDYSLINFDDATNVIVHPVYYVAVLYKRIINGPALGSVTCTNCNANFRLYAHCGRKNFKYDMIRRSSSVFYYVNMNDHAVDIDLSSKFSPREMSVWILTSGDDTSLTSPNMKLNGNLVQMNGDNVPDMPPVTYNSTNVINVPAHSLGFVSVRDGRGTACKAYYIAQG